MTIYKAAIKVLRPQAKNKEMKTAAEVERHLKLIDTLLSKVEMAQVVMPSFLTSLTIPRYMDFSQQWIN